MIWAFLHPPGAGRDFPTMSQLHAWTNDAVGGAARPTDDLDSADAVVVFARSMTEWSAAIRTVGRRPFLLFDASAGAEIAEQSATTRPSAVITTTPQTGVAHLLAHDVSVRTTGIDVRLRSSGESILIVEHTAGQFEQMPDGLARAIADRPLYFVRHTDEHNVPVSHSESSYVESIGAAMTDDRIGMVVILPCAPLLPDLPLAFGFDVVSERAPTLVDWTLVASVDGRATRSGSSVGIADLLADDELRNWLAIAAGETVRSRVEASSPAEAIVDAMRQMDLNSRATRAGLGSILPYLDTSELRALVDRSGELRAD